MAVEWHRALARLPVECLKAAIDRYIASPSTKWPVPGQIIAFAAEDAAWLRRQVALETASKGLTAYGPLELDDHPPFKPTEAEIQSVSALCAKFRAQFAGSSDDPYARPKKNHET